MTVQEYIQKLKNDPFFMKNVTEWRVLPAREAHYGEFPEALDTRVIDVLRARGTCEGSILFAPRGENGFGYDPLFLPDGYDCSMAELRPEEKNAISHRGNALKILKEELRNYYADK